MTDKEQESAEVAQETSAVEQKSTEVLKLIDAYAETLWRCGKLYPAETEAARQAVVDALGGVQALSAAPAVQEGWQQVPKQLPSSIRDRLVGYAEQIAKGACLLYSDIWEGLLAASPTPPAEQQAAPKAAPGEPTVEGLQYQLKLLTEALGACILASGIVRKDIDRFDGPQLLHFAKDLQSMLEALPPPGAAPQQEAQEPVAYAIFAENGNIRVWATESQHVKRIASEQGLKLVKLYSAPQPASDANNAVINIDKAAETLAECMDYPWAHMSEQGRTEMRKHAKSVIDAALAAQGGK